MRIDWNAIRGRLARRAHPLPFLYISWTEHCSRSDYTAAALGGPSFFPFVGNPRGALPLLGEWKIARQAVWTWAILWKHRPQVTIVRSPSVHAVVAVWLFTVLFGGRFATDNDTVVYAPGYWRRYLKLQRWLERRAVFNIVAVPALKELVELNGGRAILVPDVPVQVEHEAEAPMAPGGSRPAIVVACSYNPDEPIQQVFSAARARPHVEFVFTGHAEKLSPRLRSAAPANVRFTGFLDRPGYVALVRSAHAVMALTTRNHTMQRAGWEAIYLGRPVITSDWPILRRSFARGAVFVANSGSAIARGIDELLSEHARLCDEALEARAERLARWQVAKAEINAAALEENAGRRPSAPLAVQERLLSELFGSAVGSDTESATPQDASPADEVDPFVSIIVPVRDDPAGVAQLLACLAAQTIPPDRFEVVIADDGSQPGLEPVGETGDLQVLVLPGPPRTSYAARNRAVRAARGSVLAFCDSDCSPDPTWLERILEALHTADVVAGQVVLSPPSRPNTWSLLTIDMFLDQERDVRLSRGVTANLAMRREVFDYLGGFDESLPSGGDYDLVRRSVEAWSARLQYAPRAVIRHPTMEDARQFLGKVWFTNRWAATRSAREGSAPGLLALLQLTPLLGVILARRMALRPAFELYRPRLRASGISPTWRDDLRALPVLYLLVAPLAILAQGRGWLHGVVLSREGATPVYSSDPGSASAPVTLPST